MPVCVCSGAIDSTEVQGLLIGLQLAGDGGSSSSVDRDTMEYLFKEFDVNGDRSITLEEFNAALGRWVDERIASAATGGRYSQMLDPRQGGAAATVLADLPFDDLAALQVCGVRVSWVDGQEGRHVFASSAVWLPHTHTVCVCQQAGIHRLNCCQLPHCCVLCVALCCLQETALELEGEAADEAAEEVEGDEGGPLSAKDILVRAVIKMGAGIALCAVFSDPLVDALTNLSR